MWQLSNEWEEEKRITACNIAVEELAYKRVNSKNNINIHKEIQEAAAESILNSLFIICGGSDSDFRFLIQVLY